MKIESSRINILGVGINAITLRKAVRQIGAWIENKSHHYVNVCTVHTIMECRRNSDLRRIVNQGGLATPDGMPLVWLCRLFGHKEVTRVYGPDLMLAFCEYSVEKGYRHFFYGGGPGVAQELAFRLKSRYPGLLVVGSYSPPFRPTGTVEELAVIESINSACPDVIWVGLGTPKQDFWVAQHRSLLNAPVLIAVGAAFDIHAGRVLQAPLWMQRHGLEWFFRLIQEPHRLAYRYLIYNPVFILLVLLQAAKLRKYPIS
jgi:N-acetylglucosaminyldiphosphoundecaprenol N-acetyl-beta-D-mannosaminyltransferase